MRKLSLDEFNALLKRADTIKPRVKREVRFSTSVEGIDDQAWQERELVAITNRSGNSGILLLQPFDSLYMVSFESRGAARDNSSGRTKAVICDFCYTWRAGGHAGFVSFYPDPRSNNSTARLCCLDLECSRHVRNKTKAALTSRAQLREQMTDEDRVLRLKEHLQSFIDQLQLRPIK